MKYRLGNNKNIEEVGETLPLTCPACGKTAVFTVYSNGNMELIPAFPIVKNSTVFFTVCPHCAAAYSIDEEVGNAFKKGEKLALGNFDFKALEEFRD